MPLARRPRTREVFQAKDPSISLCSPPISIVVVVVSASWHLAGWGIYQLLGLTRNAIGFLTSEDASSSKVLEAASQHVPQSSRIREKWQRQRIHPDLQLHPIIPALFPAMPRNRPRRPSGSGTKNTKRPIPMPDKADARF